MRRRTAAVLAALVATGLSGCTASAATEGTEAEERPGFTRVTFQSTLTEQQIELDDGRVVTCVLYDGAHRAGLSCDWEGSR